MLYVNVLAKFKYRVRGVEDTVGTFVRKNNNDTSCCSSVNKTQDTEPQSPWHPKAKTQRSHIPRGSIVVPFWDYLIGF